MTRPSWIRRNRVGLMLLPVAIATAAAASSMRLVHFWWPSGPHDVTTVAVGESAHLTQDWQDRAGKHVREVDVVIKGIARTSTVLDQGKEVEPRLPKGSQLWRVSMHLAADPDQVLRGCQLEVVDTSGREYLYGPTLIEPYGILKASPCLNPGEEGPEAVIVEGVTSEVTEPRPAAYDTEADLLLPADAEPALVRIYWDHPKVIEVPVRP